MLEYFELFWMKVILLVAPLRGAGMVIGYFNLHRFGPSGTDWMVVENAPSVTKIPMSRRDAICVAFRITPDFLRPGGARPAEKSGGNGF